MCKYIILTSHGWCPLHTRGERDQNLLVETETETLHILVSTLRLRLILFISSIKARYWDWDFHCLVSRFEAGTSLQGFWFKRLSLRPILGQSHLVKENCLLKNYRNNMIKICAKSNINVIIWYELKVTSEHSGLVQLFLQLLFI